MIYEKKKKVDVENQQNYMIQMSKLEQGRQ